MSVNTWSNRNHIHKNTVGVRGGLSMSGVFRIMLGERHACTRKLSVGVSQDTRMCSVTAVLGTDPNSDVRCPRWQGELVFTKMGQDTATQSEWTPTIGNITGWILNTKCWGGSTRQQWNTRRAQITQFCWYFWWYHTTIISRAPKKGQQSKMGV